MSRLARNLLVAVAVVGLVAGCSSDTGDTATPTTGVPTTSGESDSATTTEPDDTSGSTPEGQTGEPPSGLNAVDVVAPEGFNMLDLYRHMLSNETITGKWVYDHPAPLELIDDDYLVDPDTMTGGYQRRYMDPEFDNFLSVNVTFHPSASEGETQALLGLSQLGIDNSIEIPTGAVEGGPYDARIRLFRSAVLLDPDTYNYPVHPPEYPDFDLDTLIEGAQTIAVGFRGSVVVAVAYYTTHDLDMTSTVMSIVQAQLDLLDPLLSGA